MVSGVEYSIQAMAILPQELVGLILYYVPDAGVANLRLTCQSVRACVDTFTSWPFIYRIHKIFNSIKVEHVTPKPGLTYVIDYDKAEWKTHRNGELVARSPIFPDLDSPITGCVPRDYQISPNKFVRIPSYQFQDPLKAWQFTINDDGTIGIASLADFYKLIKELSSSFQSLPFVKVSVGKIFQRQSLVQIQIRLHFDHDLFDIDHHYLLTFEVDPMKVNACYLGRRKQLIFSQGSHGIIEEFPTRGELELSKKTSLSIPPRAVLLHSHGRWLLVKNVTQVPLQVCYIFYNTSTGKEYFRYSLDRNLFPEEIYSADDLCAGVTHPNPPDNGANFNAETIFMNDSFCLFFQPPSAEAVRAALIWIEKKRPIPLSRETQQILCSFNWIKDLNYLEKEDRSCELRIEGEREGKSVQICLTILQT